MSANHSADGSQDEDSSVDDQTPSQQVLPGLNALQRSLEHRMDEIGQQTDQRIQDVRQLTEQRMNRIEERLEEQRMDDAHTHIEQTNYALQEIRDVLRRNPPAGPADQIERGATIYNRPYYSLNFTGYGLADIQRFTGGNIPPPGPGGPQPQQRVDVNGNLYNATGEEQQTQQNDSGPTEKETEPTNEQTTSTMNSDGSHPNPTDFVHGPAPLHAATVRPRPIVPPLNAFRGQYYVGHPWAIPGVPGRWEFTTLDMFVNADSSAQMAQVNLGGQGHWNPDPVSPTAEQVLELRGRLMESLGNFGATGDIGVIWVADDERDTALRNTATDVTLAGTVGPTTTEMAQGDPPVPAASSGRPDSQEAGLPGDEIKTSEEEWKTSGHGKYRTEEPTKQNTINVGVDTDPRKDSSAALTSPPGPGKATRGKFKRAASAAAESGASATPAPPPSKLTKDVVKAGIDKMGTTLAAQKDKRGGRKSSKEELQNRAGAQQAGSQMFPSLVSWTGPSGRNTSPRKRSRENSPARSPKSGEGEQEQSESDSQPLPEQPPSKKLKSEDGSASPRPPSVGHDITLDEARLLMERALQVDENHALGFQRRYAGNVVQGAYAWLADRQMNWGQYLAWWEDFSGARQRDKEAAEAKEREEKRKEKAERKRKRKDKGKKD